MFHSASVDKKNRGEAREDLSLCTALRNENGLRSQMAELSSEIEN